MYLARSCAITKGVVAVAAAAVHKQYGFLVSALQIRGGVVHAFAWEPWVVGCEHNFVRQPACANAI